MTNHQKRQLPPISPFSDSFIELLARTYTEHLGIEKSYYKSLLRELRAMNKIVKQNHERFEVKRELVSIKNDINDLKCCERARKLIQ